MKFSLLAFITFSILVFHHVDALSCLTCNTKYNLYCANSTEPIQKQACKTAGEYCVTKKPSDSSKFFERGCSKLWTDEFPPTFPGHICEYNAKLDAEVCYCNEDNCVAEDGATIMTTTIPAATTTTTIKTTAKTTPSTKPTTTPKATEPADEEHSGEENGSASQSLISPIFMFIGLAALFFNGLKI